MDRAPLSTWVHRDGKLALLGDSCHPMLVRMLPFLSTRIRLIHLRSHTEHKVLPSPWVPTFSSISSTLTFPSSVRPPHNQINPGRRCSRPRKPLLPPLLYGANRPPLARLRIHPLRPCHRHTSFVSAESTHLSPPGRTGAREERPTDESGDGGGLK